MLYATNRLLDSVWTLGYVKNDDGSIAVISYDRNNEIGYEKEKELPVVRIIEDDARTVVAVKFAPAGLTRWERTAETWSDEVPVSNKQFVFSYS